MSRAPLPIRYAKAAAKVDFKTKLAFIKLYMEHGDRDAAARAVGISENAAWGILFRPPTYRQQCNQAARDLPRETRQAFLDHMKAGKTFGEARRVLEITQEAAFGILNAALRTVQVLDWTVK